MIKHLIFPFFQEREVVEIKLRTLADAVDRIVIAEGSHTFSGIPREPVWPQIADKFSDLDIKYIPVDNSVFEPNFRFGQQTADLWGRDIKVRNSLALGLEDAASNDIIILTDADEIPNTPWIDSLNLRFGDIEHTFLHRHCYFVNWRSPTVGPHEAVCRAFHASMLQSRTVEDIARDQVVRVIPHANGWHFTYQGGVDAIVKKLGSFAHGELNVPPFNDPKHIADCLKNGEDIFKDNPNYRYIVEVGDSELPKYLVENKERFKHLWSPN